MVLLHLLRYHSWFYWKRLLQLPGELIAEIPRVLLRLYCSMLLVDIISSSTSSASASAFSSLYLACTWHRRIKHLRIHLFASFRTAFGACHGLLQKTFGLRCFTQSWCLCIPHRHWTCFLRAFATMVFGYFLTLCQVKHYIRYILCICSRYMRVEQKVHERGFLCVSLWVCNLRSRLKFFFWNGEIFFFLAKVLAKVHVHMSKLHCRYLYLVFIM